MRSWVKGSLWGALIGLVLLLPLIFLNHFTDLTSGEGGFGFGIIYSMLFFLAYIIFYFIAVPLDISSEPLRLILFYILGIVSYALIGAVIGAIIGKYIEKNNS